MGGKTQVRASTVPPIVELCGPQTGDLVIRSKHQGPRGSQAADSADPQFASG